MEGRKATHESTLGLVVIGQGGDVVISWAGMITSHFYSFLSFSSPSDYIDRLLKTYCINFSSSILLIILSLVL